MNFHQLHSMHVRFQREKDLIIREKMDFSRFSKKRTKKSTSLLIKHYREKKVTKN